jgi:hypothetical protein
MSYISKWWNWKGTVRGFCISARFKHTDNFTHVTIHKKKKTSIPRTRGSLSLLLKDTKSKFPCKAHLFPRVRRQCHKDCSTLIRLRRSNDFENGLNFGFTASDSPKFFRELLCQGQGTARGFNGVIATLTPRSTTS